MFRSGCTDFLGVNKQNMNLRLIRTQETSVKKNTTTDLIKHQNVVIVQMTMDENQLCLKYAGFSNNKSRPSGQRVFTDDLSHQCDTFSSFSFCMKAPKASENHCHHSKNTITLCAAAAARLGPLFDKADALQEGALQSCPYLLLPFPARYRHTSLTPGVQMIIPPW